MQKIAVILAGGRGVRLWPLSRQNYPKQFVEFKEGLSLFQLTIKRLLTIFPVSNIFILSYRDYKSTIYNQLNWLEGLKKTPKDYLKKNVICEPQGKSTLPAVLLALKHMEWGRGLSDNDILYVFPCDHIIEPVSKFRDSLKHAEDLAQRGKIVVFGVKIDSVQEGYGYVIAKKRFYSGLRVDKFVEKPPLEEAKRLLDKGALCNAGIFCFSKGTFLQELSLWQPRIYGYYTLGLADFLKKFKNIPAISLDCGIMQKTKIAVLVKFRLYWTDLGNWDSFFKFYMHREGNFKIGKAEFIDSKNCFTYSKDRLICLVGLQGVIAIDSPDALLLVKKGYSDRVKELVSTINKKGYLQAKNSRGV